MKFVVLNDDEHKYLVDNIVHIPIEGLYDLEMLFAIQIKLDLAERYGCTMKIDKEGGLMIIDGEGKVIFMEKRVDAYNESFKCPNANLNDYEEGVICGIGYACDACPYNPDLKENYKGVRSKW